VYPVANARNGQSVLANQSRRQVVAERVISGLDEVSRRRAWQPMRLERAGAINDIIQGGSKTGDAADPGDPAKPPGQDNV
jgi:hypothetical protein